MEIRIKSLMLTYCPRVTCYNRNYFFSCGFMTYMGLSCNKTSSSGARVSYFILTLCWRRLVVLVRCSLLLGFLVYSSLSFGAYSSIFDCIIKIHESEYLYSYFLSALPVLSLKNSEINLERAVSEFSLIRDKFSFDSSKI